MKRIVTLITCCAVFAYIIMALSQIYPPIFKKSKIGNATDKIKYRIGIGVLFDRPKTLTGKSVTYRFYQNGKWQKKQLLLEPLFDEYKKSGNFAALKHCRLDSQLAAGIHRVGKHRDISKMKQSKRYAEFMDHIIYKHNKNVKPDSVEVSYYIKNYKTGRLHLSLTFKGKP